MEGSKKDAAVLFVVASFLPLTAHAAETDYISTETATSILIALLILYSIITAALVFLLVYCLCSYHRRVRVSPKDDRIPLTPLRRGGRTHGKEIEPQVKKSPPEISVTSEKRPSLRDDSIVIANPAFIPGEPSKQTHRPLKGTTAQPAGTNLSRSSNLGSRTDLIESLATEGAHGPVRVVPSSRSRNVTPRSSPELVRKNREDPGGLSASLVTSATSQVAPKTTRTALDTSNEHPLHVVPNVRASSPRMQRKLAGDRTPSDTPQGTPKTQRAMLDIANVRPLQNVPSVRDASPRQQRKFGERQTPSSTPQGTPRTQRALLGGLTTKMASPRRQRKVGELPTRSVSHKESPKPDRVRREAWSFQATARDVPPARPGPLQKQGQHRLPASVHKQDSSEELPVSPIEDQILKLFETPENTPPGTPKPWARSHIKVRKFTPKNTPKSTPKNTPRSSPKGTPKLQSRVKAFSGPKHDDSGSRASGSTPVMFKKGNQASTPNAAMHSPLHGVGSASTGAAAPNVVSLTRELSSISYKWFEVGVQLKIKYKSLNVIRKVHGSNNEQCLIAVFEEWLKSDDEPEWTTVVQMLRSSVINEETLANMIDMRFCKKTNNPIQTEAATKPDRSSTDKSGLKAKQEFFTRI